MRHQFNSRKTRKAYHPSSRLYYTPVAMICVGAPATKRDRSFAAVHTRTRMLLVEASGWEDGGHGQGVSCTEKRDNERKLTCPIALSLLSVSPPSDGQEEERWRGVSTNENTTIKKLTLSVRKKRGRLRMSISSFLDNNCLFH